MLHNKFGGKKEKNWLWPEDVTSSATSQRCDATMYPQFPTRDLLASSLSPLASFLLPMSSHAGCMQQNTSACCCEPTWSSLAAGAWSCWSRSCTTTARLCPWRPWTYWTRPAKTRCNALASYSNCLVYRVFLTLALAVSCFKQSASLCGDNIPHSEAHEM